MEVITPFILHLNWCESKSNLIITSRYPFIFEENSQDQVKRFFITIPMMEFRGADLLKLQENSTVSHIAQSKNRLLYVEISKGNPRLLETLDVIAGDEKKYNYYREAVDHGIACNKIVDAIPHAIIAAKYFNRQYAYAESLGMLKGLTKFDSALIYTAIGFFIDKKLGMKFELAQVSWRIDLMLDQVGEDELMRLGQEMAAKKGIVNYTDRIIFHMEYDGNNYVWYNPQDLTEWMIFTP